jgi:hypothetical protein
MIRPVLRRSEGSIQRRPRSSAGQATIQAPASPATTVAKGDEAWLEPGHTVLAPLHASWASKRKLSAIPEEEGICRDPTVPERQCGDGGQAPCRQLPVFEESLTDDSMQASFEQATETNEKKRKRRTQCLRRVLACPIQCFKPNKDFSQ